MDENHPTDKYEVEDQLVILLYTLMMQGPEGLNTIQRAIRAATDLQANLVRMKVRAA